MSNFSLKDKVRLYRRSENTSSWLDTNQKGVIVGFTYPKHGHEPIFADVAFNEENHIIYHELISLNSDKIKLKKA